MTTTDIDDIIDTAPAPDRRVATSIYLSGDDHRTLRMAAAERGTSAASLVRRALRACGVLPISTTSTDEAAAE